MRSKLVFVLQNAKMIHHAQVIRNAVAMDVAKHAPLVSHVFLVLFVSED